MRVSTSADSKVLLDARNKSDEIQRRLKGEKVCTATGTPYMCGDTELVAVIDRDIACASSMQCGGALQQPFRRGNADYSLA